VKALWLALLLPAIGWAANSATLTIVAPTLNIDGTTITVPMTYTIWQGPQGAEVQVASGISALSWSADPAKLLPGTKVCWKITATETGGQPSAFSNEACKSFPQATPNAPAITIQ
jgi:hypothetical protein